MKVTCKKQTSENSVPRPMEQKRSGSPRDTRCHEDGKGGEEGMAFVRWRGNSATLLATVYDQGRSRQILLAALGSGYGVPTGIRESVHERFPSLSIDWNAVNEAMAKGPRNAPPLSETQLSYLEAEQQLRAWATQESPAFPGEKQQLLDAANVLRSWRSRTETSLS